MPLTATNQAPKPARCATYKSLTASSWAAPLLWLAACSPHMHPPVLANAAPLHQASPSPEPVSPKKSGQPQIGPIDLNLPRPAAHASAQERQFYAAATRAVRLTYEDDIDDPSQLLALRQRLGHELQLTAAKPIWLPVLDTSLERARTLRQLGPALRALRQALANSWRDEATHSYRDVDAAGCRIACAAMPLQADGNEAPLRDTVVTIEPLGVYPLHVFLQFCADPRSLFDHE